MVVAGVDGETEEAGWMVGEVEEMDVAGAVEVRAVVAGAGEVGVVEVSEMNGGWMDGWMGSTFVYKGSL